VKEHFFIIWHLESHFRKKAESGTGSVMEWYGSADPGPHENVTDPVHPYIDVKLKLGNNV
jgi:hypothetical protein